MRKGAARLLCQRRLLPLFVTQFLGAANDNLFKNALVILILFRATTNGARTPGLLVTAAAGLFILPFFLGSATAGQIADRWEKTILIRLVKATEIPIAALGAWGLFSGTPWFLLVVLTLFGVHATFFGPLKYAILPELLAEEELIAGNALIEAGTFLAILLGTIAGGLLILIPGGAPLVSLGMLTLAVGGFGASLAVPRTHPGSPHLAISGNPLRETWAVLDDLRRQPVVSGAILGISWFWFVGATFLAQFPAFAKDGLHADEQVVTLMLTMFSIGIGLGSLLCSRLLNGEISARHVPWAALGITLFSIDLAWGGRGATDGPAVTLGQFLADPAGWRVLADLLLISGCGGLYVVPLYTLLQSRSEGSHRARAVAGNNIVNALFMVGSAVAGGGLLAAGATVSGVFLVTGIANLAVAGLLLRFCRRTVPARQES
jgi:acyl-[acyl-carrier-protein]-phospholipid O-acyltransferase/long-chain-fatty-acid--[acyl-carrier-protein] ligase